MRRGGPRILFAGGGTGGHVFPGIALAQHAGTDVYWLCTTRAFDTAHLTREGIPHEALESPRWRGFKGFLAPMARAVMTAARRIRNFRPDVVVGVGGYGTVPPVVAASAMGIPYVLLEQNIRPGKANRFLAPGAARVYAQWDQLKNAFPGCGAKVVATGSPIRSQLRPRSRSEARMKFGLHESLPVLAVVGGSQGAEALNRGVVTGLNGTAKKLQVLHVTGKGRSEPVRVSYREAGARAEVREFVAEMDYLYSAADLVISRAGAMAIAELAAFGVPSVLVPIPKSSGDHQRENARAVARAGGAILMEEPACLAGGLDSVFQKLVRGDQVFDNMRRCLGPIARPKAASAILEDLGGILES